MRNTRIAWVSAAAALMCAPLCAQQVVLPSTPIGPHEVRFSMNVSDYLAFSQAAAAYAKKHPDVRFTRLKQGWERFFKGEAHFMPFVPYTVYRGIPEKFRAEASKAFAKPPTEIVLGYWTAAVFVHPGNPLAGVTMDQLRLLAHDSQATWKTLGRETDGLIALYDLDDVPRVNQILGGPPDTSPLSSRAVRLRGFANKQDKLMNDPNGMGIWFYCDRNVGTGLKILPIRDALGELIQPTDAAAVAVGRYPLRVAVRFAVHPEANQATKDFAQWLLTPEAAAAIDQARRNSTRWPAPVSPRFVHVARGSDARPAPVEPPPTPAITMTPAGTSFNDPIDGAAAVLPPQRLSTYSLATRRAHLAAYEHMLFEALTADGRLRPVDRSRVAELLEERTLQMAQSSEALAPLVAADVFLVSWIVSDAGQAYLQAQAIHGPTASLLGELRLPIRAADPLRFIPPLDETFARWWPGVLRRLADVRTKPVWTLVDVYAGMPELEESADEVRGALADALAADPQVFCALPLPLGDTQQESLFWRMGLSRPCAGRFVPASDYLLDARLDEAGRIELRLRRGNLSVLRQTVLGAPDSAQLAAAAKTWLAARLAQCAAQPKPQRESNSPAEDEWAKRQARAEHAIACQLRVKALALKARRFPDFATESWHAMLLENHEARQLLAEARRRNRRAAQLDPTWESVAHAALEPYFLHQHLFGGDNRASSPESRVNDFERFLDTFPNSPHHQEVLAWCILECIAIGNPRQNYKPLVPIEDQTRKEYFRRGLDHLREYLLRYALAGKGGYYGKGGSFVSASRAVNLFGDYVRFIQPDDDEIEAIIDQWSKDFDAAAGKVAHSDILRLQVLEVRKDRGG